MGIHVNSLPAVSRQSPVASPLTGLGVLLAEEFLLRWVISEKLLDEIDVGHDHAAAAVPIEAKLVHGIATCYQHPEFWIKRGSCAYPSSISCFSIMSR
jgi:hypothetical protein